MTKRQREAILELVRKSTRHITDRLSPKEVKGPVLVKTLFESFNISIKGKTPPQVKSRVQELVGNNTLSFDPSEFAVEQFIRDLEMECVFSAKRRHPNGAVVIALLAMCVFAACHDEALPLPPEKLIETQADSMANMGERTVRIEELYAVQQTAVDTLNELYERTVDVYAKRVLLDDIRQLQAILDGHNAELDRIRTNMRRLKTEQEHRPLEHVLLPDSTEGMIIGGDTIRRVSATVDTIRGPRQKGD